MTSPNVKFGAKVNINQSGNRIIIAAQGADNPRTMKFDNGSTTFDLQDTEFVDVNREAGAVIQQQNTIQCMLSMTD